MTKDLKYQHLQRILTEMNKVVIAYSGGVDSTFLLKAAIDTLGKANVLAAIAAGSSLPKDQLASALQLASEIGAQVITVEPAEMHDPNFTRNAPDRCFHCKTHLFQILLDIAKTKSFAYVIYGNNYDDRSDFRPGAKAAEKLGIRAPLMEAELTKAEIRQLSRDFSLPTADQPASPCLASRIPYGIDITHEKLIQVEQAEKFLREMGFVEFRVRHHGQIAKIEVPAGQIESFAAVSVREKIVTHLKSLGFTYITLDLQGFRSGSLNEPLKNK